MVTESPAFKKAVEDSRKLKAKPDNDELLEVYNSPSPDPIIPASTQKKESQLTGRTCGHSSTPSSNKAQEANSPMPRSLACSISRYAIPSYFTLNVLRNTDAFLELFLSLGRSIIDVLGLIGQSQARRVGEEVVDWPNRGAEGIRAAGGEAEGETWIYGIV